MSDVVPKLDLNFLGNDKSKTDDVDEDELGSNSYESSRSASSEQHPRLYRLNTIRFQWTKMRCIGKGNSAEVFEAYRKDTGTIFALKELTAHVGGGLDLPSRSTRLRYLTNVYQREISIVRSLAHPHIIGYIGSEVSEDNEDDGMSTSIRMRIFMENCPSGTLRSLLQDFCGNEKGLPEPVASKYAKQLLLGIAFLHYNNIAHRDLKSANVLVAENAEGEVVLKLSDFGTARDLTNPVSALSARVIDSAGIFLPGTPLWSAPEIIRTNQQDDFQSESWKRADVWSLGCVVLEMLTGELPWYPRQFENPHTALLYIGSVNEPPQLPQSYPAQEASCGQSPKKDACLAQKFINTACHMDPLQRPSPPELMKHTFLCQSFGASPQPLSFQLYQPSLKHDSMGSDGSEEEEEYEEGYIDEANSDSSEERGKNGIQNTPAMNSYANLLVLPEKEKKDLESFEHVLRNKLDDLVANMGTFQLDEDQNEELAQAEVNGANNSFLCTESMKSSRVGSRYVSAGDESPPFEEKGSLRDKYNIFSPQNSPPKESDFSFNSDVESDLQISNSNHEKGLRNKLSIDESSTKHSSFNKPWKSQRVSPFVDPTGVSSTSTIPFPLYIDSPTLPSDTHSYVKEVVEEEDVHVKPRTSSLSGFSSHPSALFTQLKKRASSLPSSPITTHFFRSTSSGSTASETNVPMKVKQHENNMEPVAFTNSISSVKRIHIQEEDIKLVHEPAPINTSTMLSARWSLSSSLPTTPFDSQEGSFESNTSSEFFRGSLRSDSPSRSRSSFSFNLFGMKSSNRVSPSPSIQDGVNSDIDGDITDDEGSKSNWTVTTPTRRSPSPKTPTIRSPSPKTPVRTSSPLSFLMRSRSSKKKVSTEAEEENGSMSSGDGPVGSSGDNLVATNRGRASSEGSQWSMLPPLMPMGKKTPQKSSSSGNLYQMATFVDTDEGKEKDTNIHDENMYDSHFNHTGNPTNDTVAGIKATTRNELENDIDDETINNVLIDEYDEYWTQWDHSMRAHMNQLDSKIVQEENYDDDSSRWFCEDSFLQKTAGELLSSLSTRRIARLWLRKARSKLRQESSLSEKNEFSTSYRAELSSAELMPDITQLEFKVYEEEEDACTEDVEQELNFEDSYNYFEWSAHYVEDPNYDDYYPTVEGSNEEYFGNAEWYHDTEWYDSTDQEGNVEVKFESSDRERIHVDGTMNNLQKEIDMWAEPLYDGEYENENADGYVGGEDEEYHGTYGYEDEEEYADPYQYDAYYNNQNEYGAYGGDYEPYMQYTYPLDETNHEDDFQEALSPQGDDDHVFNDALGNYESEQCEESLEHTSTTESASNLKQVRAVADFQGSDVGELTFNENDLILVVEQGSTGWWKGRRISSKEEHGFSRDAGGDTGDVGWFPCTYVEWVPT